MLVFTFWIEPNSNLQTIKTCFFVVNSSSSHPYEHYWSCYIHINPQRTVTFTLRVVFLAISIRMILLSKASRHRCLWEDSFKQNIIISEQIVGLKISEKIVWPLMHTQNSCFHSGFSYMFHLSIRLFNRRIIVDWLRFMLHFQYVFIVNLSEKPRKYFRDICHKKGIETLIQINNYNLCFEM